jgi:lipopolysaccharide export LptBFGC system permease protein LptF
MSVDHAMWKIHRYYLKEVGTTAALTFTVVLGIVLISLVYKGLERASGLNLLIAAQTTLLLALNTIPHLLSLSLLLATVLVFARASQDREMTALRAAGISPRTVLAPALLVGIAFSVFGSFALHYVLPAAHYSQYHGNTEVIREVILHTGLRGGRFAPPGLVMTWEERVGKSTFRDVLIFIRRKRDAMDYGALDVGLSSAREARLLTDPEGTALELRLDDVRALPGGAFLGEVRVSVSTHALAAGSRRNDVAADMSSDHVLGEVMRGSSPELDPVQARYIVNQRACFALMPALFAPIGFCIGVLSRGRGRVLALSFALFPVFLFYLADVVGKTLMRTMGVDGNGDPNIWASWFGWLPALVIAAAGIPFCWRLLRY